MKVKLTPKPTVGPLTKESLARLHAARARVFDGRTVVTDSAATLHRFRQGERDTALPSA